MRSAGQRTLLVLLLCYSVASLVHFVHNAEFLANYPGLPASWTRGGVYLAWIAMSGIGLGGWLLTIRGYPFTGLAMLAVYAALGLDSLGHYAVAPFALHGPAMNATILLEVTAAAVVMAAVARQLVAVKASRK
jgi:hypothetical protein